MKLRSAFRPLLAALAILLSPGALAPWLQLAHACPIADGAVTRQTHHDHGDTHRGQGQHPSCNCVGTCHTAALPAPPAARATSLAVIPSRELPRPAAEPFTLGPTPHLLPFAQAPPSLL